jgi:hypothetical protein
LPETATPVAIILLPKAPSADGSVMISYNVESHVLYGEEWYKLIIEQPGDKFKDLNN